MDLDVVVVGTGGIGSAAVREVAARGASVVGIDRFPPGHARGSSHGGSRVFRRAYFEDAAYVQLLDSASAGWDRLESATGRSLIHRCGVLLAGLSGSPTVQASFDSARQHGLRVELLDRDAIRARWPIFNLPENAEGLYEPDAGFVEPESGIRAHLDAARRDGAQTRWPFEVTSIEAHGDSVAITSRRETIRARRAIVTAGAWAQPLLARVGCELELTPHRKVIAWARPSPSRRADTSADRCPCWLVDDGGTLGRGVLYGIPCWPGQPGPDGMKFGFHGPGTPVDPDRFDRTVQGTEVDWFQAAIDQRLPGVFERPHAAKTCLYTMSSDEHFIVDRLPGAESISIAVGLSGHGYKFAPALGKALAELALDGESSLPIGFLSIDRFVSR